jgi:OOP family OmpA-OmpF porin
MSKNRIAYALSLTTFLVGCAGMSSYKDVAALQGATASGSPFTMALTDEYAKLAAFEQYQMFDYEDAQAYADKGLAAAAGDNVQPYQISDFNEPEEHIGELTAQRARLITALDNGGRDNKPGLAAHAQAMYDCWLEQQEENFQPDDIAACRADFMAAMAALEGTPQAWVVNFDFAKSDITADAGAILDAVAATYKNSAGGAIAVAGYTDTAGSDGYNDTLSHNRAVAVREALAARGVPASDVSIASFGEAKLAEPTGDNTPSATNRRVVINLVTAQ